MNLSKTVIFNILTVAAGIGTYLLDNELIKQNPEIVAGLGLAVGVVNLILRYYTKSPMAGWFAKKA